MTPGYAPGVLDLPALVRVIENRSKRITHGCLLRQQEPQRRYRHLSKTHLAREMNILVGYGDRRHHPGG
jgi:hypothetical protein